MNCAVTAYVEPADRAYRYDAPCTQEGHSRPVEVPLEEAETGASARLIAAAPELLKIVEFLGEWVEAGADVVHLGALFGDDDWSLADAVISTIQNINAEV
jgi:RNA:NAD 2'-phosphotransferase (TPT1/KptA family)